MLQLVWFTYWIGLTLLSCYSIFAFLIVLYKAEQTIVAYIQILR